MKDRKTSRVLNDDSVILGLSYNDVTAAGMLLGFLLFLGRLLGLASGLWALGLTSSLLIFLIPIRLRYRRKIIRDSAKYVLKKGVNNVSKYSRINRNQ